MQQAIRTIRSAGNRVRSRSASANRKLTTQKVLTEEETPNHPYQSARSFRHSRLTESAEAPAMPSPLPSVMSNGFPLTAYSKDEHVRQRVQYMNKLNEFYMRNEMDGKYVKAKPRNPVDLQQELQHHREQEQRAVEDHKYLSRELDLSEMTQEERDAKRVEWFATAMKGPRLRVSGRGFDWSHSYYWR